MTGKLKGNCLMAQSGGPTAVINASIAGVIEEAKKHVEIKGIYGAVNGILGVFNEELVDLRKEKPSAVEGLKFTPSSALGSCRHKVKPEEYDLILTVLQKYGIRYFFYAGGNDSMDTANKINNLAKSKGYELRVAGVPKTVDNDLVITDHCPGYGSVARFNAIAIRDAGRDTDAIFQPDRIKIYETMGRNAGWIAAAAALAREDKDDAPHLIYLPERPINLDRFLNDVQKVYDRLGRMVIAVSEGVVGEDGQPIAASKSAIDTDSFGHAQLGGAADFLTNLIKEKLKIKTRFDRPGTIQRAAGDRVSAVDRKEAVQVGKEAVKLAVAGNTGFMVTLVRKSNRPYRIETGMAPLGDIANQVKKVPAEFISPEGNDVTGKFLDYVRPLAGGPLDPYVRLRRVPVKK